MRCQQDRIPDCLARLISIISMRSERRKDICRNSGMDALLPMTPAVAGIDADIFWHHSRAMISAKYSGDGCSIAVQILSFLTTAKQSNGSWI